MAGSTSRTTGDAAPAASPVRLDIWLDVACLFKTRSEAKRACEGGKVEVNGEHAKPHRAIREGDRIRISRPFGRHQDVIARIVIDTHVKKSEARALFDDVSPKPTAEEIEGATRLYAQMRVGALRGRKLEGGELVSTGVGGFLQRLHRTSFHVRCWWTAAST